MADKWCFDLMKSELGAKNSIFFSMNRILLTVEFERVDFLLAT